MWKKPNRPDHAVTQPFNDGVAIIYYEKDTSTPGEMPVPIKVRKVSLCYEERRLGIHRYYEAQQNQIRVDRVIRVPDPGDIVIDSDAGEKITRINTQDMAITEDGAEYTIDLVQAINDVYPKSLDLTLRCIKQSGERSAQL